MTNERQFVPLYIAQLERDWQAHIVLGITPETLCERYGIQSTVQMPVEETPEGVRRPS